MPKSYQIWAEEIKVQMVLERGTIMNTINIPFYSYYRKTEEPENRDALFYVKFLFIYLNNFIQIHPNLLNLIKLNLT